MSRPDFFDLSSTATSLGPWDAVKSVIISGVVLYVNTATVSAGANAPCSAARLLFTFFITSEGRL